MITQKAVGVGLRDRRDIQGILSKKVSVVLLGFKKRLSAYSTVVYMVEMAFFQWSVVVLDFCHGRDKLCQS